jgi:RNase P subunit RPR2
MEAYCFKCRAKRQIKKPQQVTLKNGRAAVQGTCSQCGTTVYRIGKA